VRIKIVELKETYYNGFLGGVLLVGVGATASCVGIWAWPIKYFNYSK